MIRRLILTLTIILSILFSFVFCTLIVGQNLQKTITQSPTGKTDLSKHLSKGDTLFVIHFHPTVQCSCCINVGNFSKKGLEKYYAQHYKDKRIIFLECNIEEDTLTAKQYEIFGSALGFRRMLKGKEEFKEIESVWDFCEDESKFLPTFKKELDEFVNPEKREKEKKKE